MRNLTSRLILFLAFLLSVSSASSALAHAGHDDVQPAASRLDWQNGELCFPLQVVEPEIRYYDTCLALRSLQPDVTFGVSRIEPREGPSPGMAVYAPREGLRIPLIRTSDGQTFAAARLQVRRDSELKLILSEVDKVDFDARRSVARNWNEQLLEAIRHDVPRPTVHARNLFHVSAAMYDAWAAYDDTASPYLLGRRLHGFSCPFAGLPPSQDIEGDRIKAISYAAYRLLSHRFAASPAAARTLADFRNLMTAYGFDPDYESTHYSAGDAAALGNYIARCMIHYGLQDGSREADGYGGGSYAPVNPPLAPTVAGAQQLRDPNRWQPLSFDVSKDANGNLNYARTPSFLSPAWGQVTPFALTTADLDRKTRNGVRHWLYHDPGPPPTLQPDGEPELAREYRWNFALVALWSSHLDPRDDVLWDISPGSIGNLQDYPRDFAAFHQFYDADGGGDHSRGHAVNPRTGKPYEPQLVPRGDYARVLAEFWADGPDSETPPGHWFVILNYVSDHPLLEKRFRGTGPVLDDLEWDVKAYMALGGAMHDAAVASWSVKNWYDYVRPISAIRHMADQGQSSDPSLPSFSPEGLPLVPGFIEVVQAGDALAGEDGEHVGKIKLKAWRGPDFIEDPQSDYAGVGWILAENWWPYQRPSFVTPPFAGYVSGHSTFSRAAAEVLTLFTGDEYFPGGLGEFEAPRNDFLVFEEGPSVDVTLQWATYRDASDQCSLSRIWGGIHPPVDDLPGRHIGMKVGVNAFLKAKDYFLGRSG